MGEKAEMHVFLVRHGDAVPSHESGDRPLSDQGRREAAQMAEFLRRREVHVDEVVHSGKARAAQTAEILCRGIGFDGEMQVWTGLNPNDPVGPVAERLNASATPRMVVGHMPFMARLAGRLVCGIDEPSLVFQNVSTACLFREDRGAWCVEWLVHPGLLDFS